MRIRTADLLWAELDFAVGMCRPKGVVVGDEISPTTNQTQCNAIIEQEKLIIMLDGAYHASKRSEDGALVSTQVGQTQAEAAMRCLVHFKFGDEVDVPDFVLRPIAKEKDIQISVKEQIKKTFRQDNQPNHNLTRLNDDVHLAPVEQTIDVSDRQDPGCQYCALRDALRLMIDATGRSHGGSLGAARRIAIRVLAKAEEDDGVLTSSPA